MDIYNDGFIVFTCSCWLTTRHFTFHSKNGEINGFDECFQDSLIPVSLFFKIDKLEF